MPEVNLERYTPALGKPGLTGVYDLAIAVATREGAWRGAVEAALDLRAGERLIDVGCGTGTLALRLKRSCPQAEIVGLDPDPAALAIATGKTQSAGLDVRFVQGFAREAALHGKFDKAVSSLVFHQTPLDEKRAGLSAMFAAVKPGGRIVIADYARQTGLMRLLFRTVQSLDGYENTTPNADGFLEREIEHISAAPPTVQRINTPTGAISIFVAQAQTNPTRSAA